MKQRYRLILSLFVCFALAFSACSPKVEPVPEPEEESQPEPEPEEEPEPEPLVVDPVTERYYDYVVQNNHIAMLFGNEMEGDGFSDDEIAAYVISEFSKDGAFDWEYGIAFQAFDSVTERMFGRTLDDYETTKSTVIPETGHITSTGWGGAGIYMVLKDWEIRSDEEFGDSGPEEAGEADTGDVSDSDGEDEPESPFITATFYQIGVGMGVNLPEPEQLKRELLTGGIGDYGEVWLIQLTFQELEDLDGEMYWRYYSIDNLGRAAPPYEPYFSE